MNLRSRLARVPVAPPKPAAMSATSLPAIPAVGETVLIRSGHDGRLTRTTVTRVIANRYLVLRLPSGAHVGRTW